MTKIFDVFLIYVKAESLQIMKDQKVKYFWMSLASISGRFDFLDKL
jgi:hypothetical protein